MSATVYAYTARNSSGEAVHGTLEAAGAANALSRLQTRALFVTGLREARPRRHWHVPVPLRTCPRTAVAELIRSLAALVRAGVPMREALTSAMAQCRHQRLYDVIGAIRAEVDCGRSFGEAVRQSGMPVPAACVAMIVAGELGGSLDEVLVRVAGFLQREHRMRSRIASALTYPVIVAIGATAMLFFMIGSVVPMFASLFAQLRTPLPPQTACLVALGHVVGDPRVLTCAACAAAATVAVASRARRWSRLAVAMDHALLRLPGAGYVLRAAAHARLAQTLATLLRCGVGLIAALRAAGDALGNHAFRAPIVAAAACVREGETLAVALGASGMFEPLLIQMIAVGEQTGRVDEFLAHGAEHYDANLENALAALSAAVEPALVIFFGAVVALIAFSLYVPLYTLIGNIQ